MLKQNWLRLNQNGFLPVFSASIFSYLVAFCGSIIYTHLMGRELFGVYAFCYNIISFFLLVNGFGASSGILQFASRANSIEEANSYLRFAIILGFGFNFILALCILLYSYLMPIPIVGAKSLLLMMAFFPIGRFYIDVFQAYLRSQKHNHKLASFVVSTNLILLIANVGGIYYAQLQGFVVSTYLSYVVIIILGISIFKLPNPFSLITQTINYRKFISYSLYVTIGNAFSQMLFVLDIILLGYLIKDAKTIAIYKVATIIPFAINFIPGVVSSFFYPDFAKNANDKIYIKNLKTKVQKHMLMFSMIVSIILIVLAKPIIYIIFGAQYSQSVLPFQILSFGFWIVASFRNLNGNILAALGHAKFSMWLSVFIVIINLILTYFLIFKFGIIGAAIGVVVIYILASLIASYALRQILS